MDLLTLLLIGALGFIIVAGLGFVLFASGDGGAKTNKRMQAIAGARSEKLKTRTASETSGIRRKQIQQTLKEAERQQRRARLTMATRLSQAGLSAGPKAFWIVSGVFALVGFLIGLVAMHNPLIGLGAGFAAGFGLPRWILSIMIKGRMKKFTEEFPNAADIIVRGIKSGLPVNDCLKVISRESPEPLATEFRLLVESSAMGVSLDQSLEKMYDHMPTSEVRFFAIVLSIQQKTGGNLAEALSNLSTVLRARKLMAEKIKAMSGEAVASAFIIGSLPPGVMALVYVTAPTYMSQMFTDPRGHLLLLGAGLWMSMGIFVMRRMINFKF